MSWQKGLGKNLIFMFISALVGCATPYVFQKVEEVKTLPTEIPQSSQERYQVNDLGRAEPAPTPGPPSISPQIATKLEAKKATALKISKKESKLKTTLKKEIVHSFPNRHGSKTFPWVGEKLLFEISYFGMGGGTLSVEGLTPKQIGDRKVYHFKGIAQSSKVFSLIYRVNDTVESFMDYEGLFTHRLHVVVDESKQSRDGLELHDPYQKRTFYWNRWNHFERGYTESKEFGDLPSLAQDTFSGLYFIRSQNLKVGDVLTFPVVAEAKSFDAVVTVVRREIADSPIGPVPALVLKVDTRLQGVLQKRGDSFLYVSDDERHFPIRMEAKVKIGTIILRLLDFVPGVDS